MHTCNFCTHVVQLKFADSSEIFMKNCNIPQTFIVAYDTHYSCASHCKCGFVHWFNMSSQTEHNVIAVIVCVFVGDNDQINEWMNTA